MHGCECEPAIRVNVCPESGNVNVNDGQLIHLLAVLATCRLTSLQGDLMLDANDDVHARAHAHDDIAARVDAHVGVGVNGCSRYHGCGREQNLGQVLLRDCICSELGYGVRKWNLFLSILVSEEWRILPLSRAFLAPDNV